MMEWIRGNDRISDDPAQLDIRAAFTLLCGTYWASERSYETFAEAASHSICFGLYRDRKLIGFARAVTDRATFSWICDVVVDSQYRGQGLGKWLVTCVLEHPVIARTKQRLATKDAHSLYERFGFERSEALIRSPVRKGVVSGS